MSDEQLSTKESLAIQLGLEALNQGGITFTRPKFLKRYVAERAPRLGNELLQRSIVLKESASDYGQKEKPTIAYPPRPRAWDIGLSDEFAKTIDEISGKLARQVLKAIREISRDPVSLKGDTIKPLTADMKGCWRYRVGDFRIVYQPDTTNRRVAILAFASRGDIYQ